MSERLGGEESPDDTDQDWSDVERIINDLKNDGYDVAGFNSNTSDAAPSKRFVLEVVR